MLKTTPVKTYPTMKYKGVNAPAFPPIIEMQKFENRKQSMAINEYRIHTLLCGYKFSINDYKLIIFNNKVMFNFLIQNIILDN